MMAHESEWTWYIAEVAQSASKLKFTGSASGQCQIGVWVWADWDLKATTFTLEMP